MKLIGEYTCRGQMDTENTWNLIQLFDGDFSTAYKLVDFEIAPRDTKTAANDVAAKISISDQVTSDGAIWNWQDSREIAWASSETRVSFGPSFGRHIIDEENIIIEDLYICYGHVSTDSPVNYYLRFEKYSIDEWKGTLAMAAATAKGDDA